MPVEGLLSNKKESRIIKEGTDVVPSRRDLSFAKNLFVPKTTENVSHLKQARNQCCLKQHFLLNGRTV